MTRPAPSSPWQVEWHDTVASTMDLARRAARADAPHRSAIAARQQSAGRGRSGHTWASPRGGLYASLVLREPTRALAPVLPLAAGLAVCHALDALAPGLDARLKWPNDVVARDPKTGADAKVAGVLAEAGARGATLAWVVIGIGMNLATESSALPAADPPAASLVTLGHEAPEPEHALHGILDALDAILEEYVSDAEALSAAASERLAYRGESVQVRPARAGDAVLRGILLRVAPTGHLVLKTDDAERAVAPWDATGLRGG